MALRIIICFVLFGLSSTYVVAAPSLEDLVKNGQFKQAYELGKTQLAERAGEPEFDFLFGMAAMESGRPQEAVFAFERVIAVTPSDHRARLELARAYFMLENFDQAKELFDVVLASDPPQRVKENIKKFLDEIEARNRRRDSQFSASAELKMGSDTNINSATEVESVSLPIGLVLTLGETSREISDEFAELAVNAGYIKFLRKDMGLFTALSISDRHNSSYSQFDLRISGLSLGYVYKAGNHTVRLPLQYQVLEVARDTFRTSAGFGGEWTYRITPNQQIAFFGQWAQLRHKEDLKYRNADLTLFGGAWNSALQSLPVKLNASVYAADESSVETGFEYIGRSFAGVRLGLALWPHALHEINVSHTYQAVEHDAIQVTFNKVREDDFNQTTFDWGWRFAAQWRAGISVSYIKNSSNLDIYTYRRTQKYATLKYHF